MSKEQVDSVNAVNRLAIRLSRERLSDETRRIRNEVAREDMAHK